MTGKITRIAERTSLIYWFVASVWIFTSDILVKLIAEDFRQFQYFQIFKGMGFVTVTAILIYIFLRKQLRSHNRSKEAMRESEDKYRALFENMSEGFALNEIITDENGKPCDFRLLEVNAAFERLTGLKASETVGRRLLEIVPESKWIERYGQVALAGESTHIEEYSTSLNRWFQVFAYQPKASQCAFVFTDITERKELEGALKESEKNLRELIRSLPDMIWLKDPQGIYLACNPRLEEYFGAKEKDIIGKTDYDFVDEETAQSFRRRDQLAISKGESRTDEETVTFPDGHQEILETIKTPIVKSDGRISGVLGIGRDITTRKRVEKELEWSVHRNELLSTTAASLLQSGDPQQLVEDICRQVMRFIDGQVFFNFLDESQKKKLRLNAYAGISEQQAKEIELLDHGTAVCGCVARDRERMICEDIQNADDPLTDLVKSFGIQSYCCHPLMIRECLIGTLSFGSRTKPKFTAKEIDLMESVANLVAAAMNRIETENALRRSETLLNMTQRISKVGGWEWDLTRQEAFWTEETYRIHDIDMDENLVDVQAVIDKSVECFVEEDRPRILEALNLCSQEGVPYDLECRFVSKKGRRLWVRTSGKAVWEDGRIVKVHGDIQDITEQKEAEQSLHDQNQFIKTILDNLPIGLAVNYIGDGKVTYANKQFEKIYGWPKEQILDVERFFEKVYPDPQYRETVKKQIYEDIGSGDPERMMWDDMVITTQTGEQRFVFAKNIPLYDQNLMISTVQDITDSRQLQMKLHQAQKMEAVGNLAGGIAHDFNNILMSIIGFTELSLAVAEEDSIIEDNLQEIYRAGMRARDLVRQILAFARQSEEPLKPMQVDTIAKEVLKFIRSSIPANIDIQSNIASDSLIMGSPTQIHQIFMNLFANAAHAMENDGGLLSVSLKDVIVDRATGRPIAGLKSGDYILIEVSDTGEGIRPELINKIFEPYFTTKGPGEGTGMGLATVHGIVESYGGKITVESQPGKGATFLIYLPITRKRRARREYKPEQLPVGTERILVVDDEAPIAELGRRMLERLGYLVTTRTSSVEALELFRSRPDDFDLIITDMTMPNMTGDQFADELMKIRPGVPVILCTGYSKRISDASAAEIGLKAIVYKPIVQADLARTVRRVLDETDSAR